MIDPFTSSIGLGGFESGTRRGIRHVRDPGGGRSRLAAGALGRLLGDRHSVRLAILAAPADPKRDDGDEFAASATTLVRRGVPSVVTIPSAASESGRAMFWRAAHGRGAWGVDRRLDRRGASRACGRATGTLRLGCPGVVHRCRC